MFKIKTLLVISLSMLMLTLTGCDDEESISDWGQKCTEATAFETCTAAGECKLEGLDATEGVCVAKTKCTTAGAKCADGRICGEVGTTGVMYCGYSSAQFEIATPTIPDATVGKAFTHQLEVNGSTGNFYFEATGTPAWLSVDASGLMTGTPTEVGDFNFSVIAYNGKNGVTIFFNVIKDSKNISVKVVVDGDPCDNVTCGANETCNPTSGVCECSTGFHTESNTCMSDTKMVACTTLTTVPENAVEMSAQVEVTWDGADYSDAAECMWDCKEGYKKEVDKCVQGTYEDPCLDAAACDELNKTVCTDADKDGVAECGCDAMYHSEDDGATCTSDTKKVNCDDSATPTNAAATVVEVDVMWENSAWAAPVACAWTCNNDFHNESGLCVADVKSVDCLDLDTVPDNAHQVDAQVTVVWNGTTWEPAASCIWACDTNFTSDGEKCVAGYVDPCADTNPCTDANKTVCTDDDTNGVAECGCDSMYHSEDDGATCVSDSDMVDCLTQNVPTHATADVQEVEVTWNGAAWSTASICNWNCDTDYEQDGQTCINERSADCATDSNNPANSSYDVVTVIETFTTAGGWVTPMCAWSCVDGYVLNGDSSACVESTVTPKLIISEYLEGGSSNKAIELYNVSGGDLDLSTFTVALATNANDWNETELSLTGMLASNTTYVICNSSFVEAEQGKCDLLTGTSMGFNGNDAIGLKENGVLIDIIGVPGSNVSQDVAGVSSATTNHTLVRKESIAVGNINWTASAGTNVDDSEWTVLGQDNFGSLGIRGLPATECTNGATEERLCGSDHGSQGYECVNGFWELEGYCDCDDGYEWTGTCTEISTECTDGDPDEDQYCGDDHGIWTVKCVDNVWVPQTECFCDAPANGDMGYHWDGNTCTANTVCGEGVNDADLCGDNHGLESKDCVDDMWVMSGTCECETGYTWDGSTCVVDNSCTEDATDTQLCGDGHGVWDVKCISNAWVPQTECLCDAPANGDMGYHWDGNTCTANTVCGEGVNDADLCGDNHGLESKDCVDDMWVMSGTCECETGYTWDGSTCVVDNSCTEDATDTQLCGDGHGVWDVKCISNAWVPQTECLCDAPANGDMGYHWDGNTCTANTVCGEGVNDADLCGDNHGLESKDCVDDMWVMSGTCECETGYTWDGSTCVADATPVVITYDDYLTPETLTIESGVESVTIYGQVYATGVTDGSKPEDTRIQAVLCYVDNTTSTEACNPAVFDMTGAGNENNNHQYRGTITFPVADDYAYYFKYSGDSGATWTEYESDWGYATVTEGSGGDSLVIDGDFEAGYSGWTTIDADVTVGVETTIVYSGSQAISVGVETGDQGNTDFRQTITVEDGATYNVSMWVYHPAGSGVKVRMYDTDYGDYSDNTLADQWQEVVGSFTASGTTADVGFRFYDQSGDFTPGEVIYIDDFTVTKQ